MATRNWTILEDVHGSVLAVTLVDTTAKLKALVRQDRIRVGGDDETDRFEVRFSSTSESGRGELYARAEAARLFAEVCDTAGDLAMAGATDEPLDVRDPGMVGSTVELIGRDAGVCVATFFREPVTSELMELFY